MTPYLTMIAMDGRRIGRITDAYTAASFYRVKKLPPLEQLLKKKTGNVGERMKDLKASLGARIRKANNG